MVIGLLKFLLFVFIVYVAYLFVRVYFGLKTARKRASAPPRLRGLMVKDEVCNTYVPRDEALTDVRDGVERYFCSEECRRKFREG